MGDDETREELPFPRNEKVKGTNKAITLSSHKSPTFEKTFSQEDVRGGGALRHCTIRLSILLTLILSSVRIHLKLETKVFYTLRRVTSLTSYDEPEAQSF